MKNRIETQVNFRREHMQINIKLLILSIKYLCYIVVLLVGFIDEKEECG